MHEVLDPRRLVTAQKYEPSRRSWARRWVLSTAPSRHTLLTKAGHKKSTAHTGATTLIQRFGSALNLNIHFHMLFLDGVYVGEAASSARFRWVKAPTSDELTQLAHTIAHRLARYQTAHLLHRLTL